MCQALLSASQQSYKIGTVVIPILQMRKSRLRKLNFFLAQVNTTSNRVNIEWKNWNIYTHMYVYIYAVELHNSELYVDIESLSILNQLTLKTKIFQ